MAFKKYLIFLLLPAIIVSCNTENDSIEKPEIIPPIEYTFVKMEFINSEQSGKSEQYENTPTIEYLNYTGITQTFPYNPLYDVYETSQFSGIDSSIINHIINSPIISVPINIDNLIYLGVAKWPISNITERQLTSLNLESNILIESNTKLTLKTKLHYMKISTNMRLTLIDDKENKEHIFEGKWVGVYPINAEIETSYTDL